MASKSSMVTSSSGLGTVGAGVVDEDVEGLGLGDRGLHGRQVGHIEHERLSLLPTRPDRRCRCLDLAARARGQRHVRPSISQR